MADKYIPSKADVMVADISAFVADVNAINAATKTALNTAIANISALFWPTTLTNGAAHPDFNKIDPATAAKIANELTQLQAAVTAHA